MKSNNIYIYLYIDMFFFQIAAKLTDGQMMINNLSLTSCINQNSQTYRHSPKRNITYTGQCKKRTQERCHIA